MAGYVRQSAADIVPTAVVRAAPINNELNALRDAFAQATGHKHDGTAAEGHYIPVIGDADAKNKVAVDTVNNRVGVFTEVSTVSTEQVRFQDGAIVPVTDNDIDLGTSSLEFKDLYIDGTANIDSLIADTADINAGTIDNTVVGATTPAAATVTTLTATGASNLNGTTIPASKTLVVTTDKLSVLAATSSSELAGIISDETGSGALVFANTPTLVSPVLGTPTSATLTNATGLPLASGVTGTLPVANGGTGITSFGAGVATFLGTPSSSNLAAAVTDETGSGALVFANSPTLVTPALGTPSSATLTNATGLPISTGVSGLGTNVATALSVAIGSAGAPVVNGGALGTPSSGVATNLTGLPLTSGVTGTLPVANGGTGISSLGTGVATFLGTPSSSNLAAAVTDETGTGALVFANNPTLVTPTLGTPASATLTNATGLPLSTGVTGTLPIANGGTSATTALGARTALLPSFTGNAGKVAAVNAGATDIEYITVAGTGTVTSVGGTGSVNGITLSGTVTASGDLTLGGTLSGVSLTTQVSGTLPIANGGTGLTSPGTAGNILTSNGTTWTSEPLLANVVDFASSGTWTKPAGATFVIVECWAAGGGGGSGRRGATSTNTGGGGGGSGGAYIQRLFKASDLADTVTVTIGSGGTGGNGVGSNSTNGNTGNRGGSTSFSGNTCIAYGGYGGNGGTGSNGISTFGGGYNAVITPDDSGQGFGALAGGISEWGGSSSAYKGIYAGAGGGTGGSINNSNALSVASAGGGISFDLTTRFGGGGAANTNGGAVTGFVNGTGGGGGSASTTASASVGRTGGICSGGGGGGASRDGFASGAGGAGGNGYCRVYSW